MVVYQALHNDFSTYVMPYDMFIKKVDFVQYPNAKQQYCFEEVELEKEDFYEKLELEEYPTSKEKLTSDEQHRSEDTKKHLEQPEVSVYSTAQSSEEESNTNGVDPRLLLFLDARTYEEKLNVLSSLRNNLDDKLINVIALSLDVEVPEGNIDARYMSLRRCILAHAKYEGTRLR